MKSEYTSKIGIFSLISTGEKHSFYTWIFDVITVGLSLVSCILPYFYICDICHLHVLAKSPIYNLLLIFSF